MSNVRSVLLSIAAMSILNACSESSGGMTGQDHEAAIDEFASVSERLNAWFEADYEAEQQLSPAGLTVAGRRDRMDEWDEITQTASLATYDRQRLALEDLRGQFDPDELTGQDLLSYRLYEHRAELTLDGQRFDQHGYVFHHMDGLQSALVSVLMNQHLMETREDAEAYIVRLNGLGVALDQAVTLSADAFENGIHPPAFIYDYVIGEARNLTTGAPFDDSGDDSVLLADFKSDVAAMALHEDIEADLISRALVAIETSVAPAYVRLIAALEDQQSRAPDSIGASQLPDGQAYYAWLLRRYTSTDLTPQEIHEIGLREVARIQAERAALRERVGFEGTAAEFFGEFNRPEFTYSADDEGREEFLADVNARIDRVCQHLPDWFNIMPRAPLEVRPVEPYREASSAAALYEQPSEDGSRPGVYYLNLSNPNSANRARIEAVMFHEALPGHHMQVALAQELEGIPAFRRNDLIFPYVEGWGLYAELVGKEMGFYQDPYSDYDRLGLELLRANRLVIDTGIHAMGWTREEANARMAEIFGVPATTTFREIDRYFVIPGQATAYFIGRNKILELREEARETLGDRFDIRAFHDVVLSNGPVPLILLEELVDDWVESTLNP